MGRAILSGLSAPHVRTAGITVTGRDSHKLADLAGRDTVQVYSTSTDEAANLKAVRDAGLVIVAVKPAGVTALLAEIAPGLAEGTVVVSVAAGVTVAAMETVLPEAVGVVRAMPNTPSMIGRGMTGLSAGTRTTADQLDLAQSVFRTVGDVLVVPETQIDALTAISGSGPAYVFYLIESWVAAARELGFTDEQAQLLVESTFRGAAELVAVSGQGPAELRRRVTSPNGTTERALGVLEGGALPELFTEAARAAARRAGEIAREYS